MKSDTTTGSEEATEAHPLETKFRDIAEAKRQDPDDLARQLATKTEREELEQGVARELATVENELLDLGARIEGLRKEQKSKEGTREGLVKKLLDIVRGTYQPDLPFGTAGEAEKKSKPKPKASTASAAWRNFSLSALPLPPSVSEPLIAAKVLTAGDVADLAATHLLSPMAALAKHVPDFDAESAEALLFAMELHYRAHPDECPPALPDLPHGHDADALGLTADHMRGFEPGMPAERGTKKNPKPAEVKPVWTQGRPYLVNSSGTSGDGDEWYGLVPLWRATEWKGKTYRTRAEDSFSAGTQGGLVVMDTRGNEWIMGNPATPAKVFVTRKGKPQADTAPMLLLAKIKGEPDEHKRLKLTEEFTAMFNASAAVAVKLAHKKVEVLRVRTLPLGDGRFVADSKIFVNDNVHTTETIGGPYENAEHAVEVSLADLEQWAVKRLETWGDGKGEEPTVLRKILKFIAAEEKKMWTGDGSAVEDTAHAAMMIKYRGREATTEELGIKPGSLTEVVCPHLLVQTQFGDGGSCPVIKWPVALGDTQPRTLFVVTFSPPGATQGTASIDDLYALRPLYPAKEREPIAGDDWYGRRLQIEDGSKFDIGRAGDFILVRDPEPAAPAWRIKSLEEIGVYPKEIKALHAIGVGNAGELADLLDKPNAAQDLTDPGPLTKTEFQAFTRKIDELRSGMAGTGGDVIVDEMATLDTSEAQAEPGDDFDPAHDALESQANMEPPAGKKSKAKAAPKAKSSAKPAKPAPAKKGGKKK